MQQWFSGTEFRRLEQVFSRHIVDIMNHDSEKFPSDLAAFLIEFY